MGPRAKKGEEDFDLVDAMKVPVTLIPGASFFAQEDAHVMTRGGHLDVCILGGLQVSERGRPGELACPGRQRCGRNWRRDGYCRGGSATDRDDGAYLQGRRAKIVTRCDYPLTAVECVNTIITDLAVIDVEADGLRLREVAPGFTADEVQGLTEPKLNYIGKVPEMFVSSR